MAARGLNTGTPVQGTSKLSSKIQAVYDRMLLTRATDSQLFDVGGQVKTVPARSNTKKAFAYRYKNMLPATTPIAEYNGSNIKAPGKITREEVEYDVKHYGDYIVYTDELDLYDLDNIKSSFLDILGDQASLTLDTIRRDVLRGGTNVVFADGEQPFEIVAGAVKAEGGEKSRGAAIAIDKGMDVHQLKLGDATNQHGMYLARSIEPLHQLTHERWHIAGRRWRIDDLAGD